MAPADLLDLDSGLLIDIFKTKDRFDLFRVFNWLNHRIIFYILLFIIEFIIKILAAILRMRLIIRIIAALILLRQDLNIIVINHAFSGI